MSRFAEGCGFGTVRTCSALPCPSSPRAADSDADRAEVCRRRISIRQGGLPCKEKEPRAALFCSAPKAQPDPSRRCDVPFCRGLRIRHSPYLLGFEKQARQGAPQTPDDGDLTVVEFGGEEQRSIATLIGFELILPNMRHVSADHSADPPPCRPSQSCPFPAHRHGRQWKAPFLRSAQRAERLRHPWKPP